MVVPGPELSSPNTIARNVPTPKTMQITSSKKTCGLARKKRTTPRIVPGIVARSRAEWQDLAPVSA